MKYFTINYILNFLYIIYNEKSFNENFLLRKIYNDTKTKSEDTLISHMQ